MIISSIEPNSKKHIFLFYKTHHELPSTSKPPSKYPFSSRFALTLVTFTMDVISSPPSSQTRFHPDFNKEVFSVVFSVRFSPLTQESLFNVEPTWFRWRVKGSRLILPVSQCTLNFYTTCCTMTLLLAHPKKALSIIPSLF